jgi:hypothetical protein
MRFLGISSYIASGEGPCGPDCGTGAAPRGPLLTKAAVRNTAGGWFGCYSARSRLLGRRAPPRPAPAGVQDHRLRGRAASEQQPMANYSSPSVGSYLSPYSLISGIRTSPFIPNSGRAGAEGLFRDNRWHSQKHASFLCFGRVNMYDPPKTG